MRFKPIYSFMSGSILALFLALSVTGAISQQPATKPSARKVPDLLLRNFMNPPKEARLRCYWWWLNGRTTEATIKRDLTEMHAKGYGGVLLVDANGSGQNKNMPLPPGPEFGSQEWLKLFTYAVTLADELGMEVTLNLTSGWNLGGPWVKPEAGMKLLTWSRTEIDGSATTIKIPDAPAAKNGFYMPVALLAYPLHAGDALAGSQESTRLLISNLPAKSASIEFGRGSMPDVAPLMGETEGDADDQTNADARHSEVVDITSSVSSSGMVNWRPPAGNQDRWELLRIGYTSSNARVSTSSGAWQGLAIDYLDPAALTLYWNTTVEPLLQSVKPYVGGTLKNVATDSWELGGTNWTGAFRAEFLRRRGYDPVTFLPVLAGRILDSRLQSDKFLADMRRTVADLVNEHYRTMAALAAAHGMGIQCESGGPHGAPIDGPETFRFSAVPQTEYWAMSPEHRSLDSDRFFVKEASSAAHLYGKRLAAAEGMTSVNQWEESLDLNLKASFDQALTEGLNRLVWHAFTSSPPELGLPGQEYFAGTHLNPQTTWWQSAGPFLAYLNRAQYLLQQGLPVSDLLYYTGDSIPNFIRLKRDDPSGVLPGYDYDGMSTDAIARLRLVGSTIETPEGIQYRALSLPKSHILPLAALRFAEKYVEGGGNLIGSRPLRASGLQSAEEIAEFQKIADHLYIACEQSGTHRDAVGKGHVYCAGTAHDAMEAIGILPDFEVPPHEMARLDFVHRTIARSNTDIYFVRNTSLEPLTTVATFRVNGRQPEIFDAVTGKVMSNLMFLATQDNRTALPLSLEPRGSIFVVFRRRPTQPSVTQVVRDGRTVFDAELMINSLSPGELSVSQDGPMAIIRTSVAGRYEITRAGKRVSQTLVINQVPPIAIAGPWTLSFPSDWGAPAKVSVVSLKSWTDFPEDGIRYFSGTATYRIAIRLSAKDFHPNALVVLNLGEAHEVLRVRVNGHDTGVLWKRPFRLEVGTLLHAGDNELEVDVTNFWPNRLIGDARSADGKHYTWTNILKYKAMSPLMPSGLVGPVTLESYYSTRLH